MLRRPTALITCLTFVLNLCGCTSPQTQLIPPETIEASEYKWIDAVTTRSGEVIEFDTISISGAWGSHVQKGTHAEVRGDSIFALVDAQPQAIALADVKHVWINQSKISPGLTIAGIGLGAIVVGGIILVIAANSQQSSSSGGSCPFVYSWDGERYIFDAEPFAGAISKGLERDDYSELENLKAVDGEYRLLVANEMAESDYFNLTELCVVDHPAGTRVAADVNGDMHVLADPVQLLEASDAEGHDLQPWLEATDRRIWESVPDSEDGVLREEIVMSFPRPAGTDQVKLIANVRTSSLGALMISEMLALRGKQLPLFYQYIDNVPAAQESLQAWNLREELFILQLEVEERDGWKVRGHLPGEALASETVVVPMDISGVDGELLRIRIRPPVGFWALNSFAVDFGQEQTIRTQFVPPREARDRTGSDVLSVVLEADDTYLALPETGDWAKLIFPAPRMNPHQERTVFLHSRGYYVLHLPTEHDPDLETLDQIATVPDGAARFAAERFRQWQAESLVQRGER